MGGYWSSSSSANSATNQHHQERMSTGSIPPSERRVLIAVDGSVGAENAFNFWASSPGSQHDEVILFNTLEMPNTLSGLLLSQSGTFDHEEYAKHSRVLRQRAEALQSSFMRRCQDRGLRCRFVTEVADSPGVAIVDAARKYGANVVVVGCRGNNGIRRTILGSVSDYVLQHSARPIVVVPSKQD